MASSGALADFGRMPTRNKVLLFAAIGGVLGFFYYKFAYTSLAADVKKAKQAQVASAAKYRQIEEDIPRYVALRARKDQLDEAIRELQKALPTEAEVPAFFGTIDQKLTDAGIDKMKFQKGSEEPFDQFVKVPLQVEMTGTFMQIKRFFASLVEKRRATQPGQPGGSEERERIVTIENLALTAPTLRNREILLTAKFTAVTFKQQAAAAPTGAPGEIPANAPAPAPAAGSGGPASSEPPPLPSAATPAGAKARVEDAMEKDVKRTEDGLKAPAGSGSGLKGGL